MRARNLIVVLSLLLCIPVASAKMYKWVDDDGNVYYSDKVPPSQVKHSRKEMSKQGVEVRETPRAKTPEEVEQERELNRLRAERNRLIEKQKAADRVLLRTFRSEDDIVLAQDGKLAAIDVMIIITQSNIRRQQTKLTQLQKKAASRERSGKKVPEKLLSSINTTLNNINKGYSTIERKEADKQIIRDTFSRDLQRFRDLKKIRPEATAKAAQVESYYDLDNLLNCPDAPTCDAAWKRAEEFVLKNATTPLQMLSEQIIMTNAPAKDQDVSITIARIESRTTGKTVLFMDLYCKDTPLGKAHCASTEVDGIRTAYKSWVGGGLQSGGMDAPAP